MACGWLFCRRGSLRDGLDRAGFLETLDGRAGEPDGFANFDEVDCSCPHQVFEGLNAQLQLPADFLFIEERFVFDWCFTMGRFGVHSWPNIRGDSLFHLLSSASRSWFLKPVHRFEVSITHVSPTGFKCCLRRLIDTHQPRSLDHSIVCSCVV